MNYWCAVPRVRPPVCACSILTCAHNKNAHAACIRHCETAQREIACPICREVVKVAPPPAQASKSFGRFG